MEGADAARYWCYMCSQMVNPIMEVEIKCPFCDSGFVEEMSSTASRDDRYSDLSGSDSDQALSLWAPFLLGMMSNPRRRLRFRRLEFEDEEESDDTNQNFRRVGGENGLDRQLESIVQRRRRISGTILELLQGIRARRISESDSTENNTRNVESHNGERERMVLINPFNQTVIIQSTHDSNNNSQNQNQVGSLGDYFIGPGLDLLLQNLTENDPNSHGTLPAQKEAVEAMPRVTIEETLLQCSICLEDFDIGAEARQLPCKHKFHGGCILPWLELHSSCPVCRYQLPSVESKLNADVSRNSSDNGSLVSNNGSFGNESSGDEGDGDERNNTTTRFSVSLPWPFSSLFSSSGSQTGNESSSSTSRSSSRSSTAPQNAPHTDES